MNVGNSRRQKQKKEIEVEKREKRQKEIKKNFRKLTVKEVIEIVRVVGKKENNLIEVRMVEEIMSKRFYKYFKMFKKKESERI